MKVLLSTIGSRGDVQPLVALALELKAIGQDVSLCVPPDFCTWIESLGLPVAPIGPELKSTGRSTSPPVMPTPEQRARMMEETVATQFATLSAASRGCDLIVGATALQIAAPSIAEHMGVPYIFVAYCPAVLPSAHHAPPTFFIPAEPPSRNDFEKLWAEDAARLNGGFGPPLNLHRAKLGLGPVEDVRSHVLTRQPWLACDPVLGPWSDPADNAVVHAGSWLIDDKRPLDAGIEGFLDAGDPPVYFGFGSIRAPQGLSQAMIGSARALGRRAIILRGWADLELVDDSPDCLLIGEVNQRALFRRVAAVVHHGGAGTTTAAALSGAPQVIVPQVYDQPYWAQQIEKLGAGVAHAPGAPSEQTLTAALQRALQPQVAESARKLANVMTRDGAARAARHLIDVMAPSASSA